jgi:hypothetical protein
MGLAWQASHKEEFFPLIVMVPLCSIQSMELRGFTDHLAIHICFIGLPSISHATRFSAVLSDLGLLIPNIELPSTSSTVSAVGGKEK